MSTAELKLTIFELLTNTKDGNLLTSIYKQLKSPIAKKETDFWGEFSDEQKAEIEESIAQAERGEVISHEVVINGSII